MKTIGILTPYIYVFKDYVRTHIDDNKYVHVARIDDLCGKEFHAIRLAHGYEILGDLIEAAKTRIINIVENPICENRVYGYYRMKTADRAETTSKPRHEKIICNRMD